MSKIQDTITEINGFLDAADQSVTPRVRRLAKEYAAACSQVARELDECRNLIRRGLLLDAQAMNRRETPTLCEKAAMLDFPRRADWTRFCREFSLAEIPDPDMETVAKLRPRAGEREKNAAELILRWRKIARTGGNGERVHLLRQIVAVVQGDVRSWKTNLAGIEKNYIAELLEQAAEALSSANEDELEKIYAELTSPELLNPVPPAPLKRISEEVAAIRRRRTAAEAAELLDTLAEAYSAMDFARMNSLLARWEKYAEDAEFHAAPEQLEQVRDVRSFLAEHARSEVAAAEFDRLKKQLLKEFDENTPFRSIERTYRALELLELPIDPKIAERFTALGEEYALLEHRRHVRKCLYGIVGAVLAVLCVGTAVKLISERRELAEAGSEMRKLIAGENFDGAVKVADTMRQTSPDLADDPEIVALRAQAIAAKAARLHAEAAGRQEFERLAKRIPALLTEQTAEYRELAALLAGAEKQRRYLDRDALDRLDAFNRTANILRMRRRELREKAFSDGCEKLEQALAEASSALRSGNPDELEKRVRTYEDKRAALERVSSDVNPVLKARRKELWRARMNLFNAKLGEARRNRAAREKLFTPASHLVYFEGLKQLDATPYRDDPDYRAARDLVPMYEALLQRNYDAETLGDDAKLAAAVKAQLLLHQGVRQRDLMSYAPPGAGTDDPLKTLNDRLAAFLKSIAAECNLYELVFTDKDNRIYRFYTKDAPLLERKGGFNTIRAIALGAVLHSGQNPVPIDLTIPPGRTVFVLNRENDTSGLDLPDRFVALRNWNMRKPVFAKAEHYLRAEKLVRRCASARNFAEARAAFEEGIGEIAAADTMNPYMQLALLRALLSILGETSGFYSVNAQNALLKLNRPVAGRAYNWLNPGEAVRHDEEVQGIRRAVADVNVPRMIRDKNFLAEVYRAFLLRDFLPAGVFHRNEQGEIALHKFVDNAPNELFVLEPADGTHPETIRMLPVSLWRRQTVPAQLTKFCRPGSMLFTSGDGADSRDMAAQFDEAARRNGCELAPKPAMWPRTATP